MAANASTSFLALPPAVASALAVTGCAAAAVGLLVSATWPFHRNRLLDDKHMRVGDASHKKFVMDVCGGPAFVSSVLTLAFVRTSMQLFAKDVLGVLRGLVVAAEGRPWPDAAVVALDAGTEAPLRLHSFRPKEAGRPLVINFGSWS